MQLQSIKQHLFAGRNIFLAGTVLTLSVLLIAACQKSADKPFAREAFDMAAMKEWFYGSFAKTAEYRAFNKMTEGSKLPDWTRGRAVKVGDYNAVEYPLNRQKAKVTIAENAGITEADRNRIAQAAVARAFIIKKGNKMLFREALYIPDIDYLARHHYDISTNGYGKIDPDFSGTIQIKDWTGNEISRSILRDGKVKKRVKGTIILAGNKAPASGRIACNGTLVTEYARDCEVHIYSDNMVTEQCGEWFPTGNQWCYEDGEVNPCEDPANPICACQVYGLCEGGDGSGGGDDGTCQQSLDDITGIVADDVENTSLLSETQNQRVKYYDWTFYKQNWGLWKFVSHDKGVHIKDNGFWRWESITHLSETFDGTIAGGSLDLRMIYTESWHSMVFASMTLHYHLTATIMCLGRPFSRGWDGVSSRSFSLND